MSEPGVNFFYFSFDGTNIMALSTGEFFTGFPGINIKSFCNIQSESFLRMKFVNASHKLPIPTIARLNLFSE
jgi:hypothetical protein